MRQMILWGGLFLFTLLIQMMARKLPGFAEWYAVHIYPAIMRVLGGISDLAPFALDELFIYLLTLAALLYVVFGVRKMIKKRIRMGRWFLQTGKGLLKIGILWFLVFTANCGVNYHRTPFSELAGLRPEEATVEELEELCLWLTDRIEETADQIMHQENGLCALPGNLRDSTRDAMMRLGEQYPQLSGWYPKAKPVWTWRVLSLENLEGIYGPYTMEAHYNPDIPAYNQPAVLCHELSHLKGFMREDEANYIAYLACTGSEDANLKYSGLLLAYTHSINALYRADRERALEVRAQLCRQAELDYAYHRYYWQQYESQISALSDKVNDVYLKANAQSEGSKSYGRMVDLLIGEYRQIRKEEN